METNTKYLVVSRHPKRRREIGAVSEAMTLAEAESIVASGNHPGDFSISEQAYRALPLVPGAGLGWRLMA